MRNILDRVPFRFINYIYWFLLLYLLAALAWWYIELVQQNELMFNFKKTQLLQSPNIFSVKAIQDIENERDLNAKQYIGEGLTFMIITIIGAVFVYGVVRRQIRLHMQQNNFMMAVTHELKTPIAITKLSLETLRRHKLDEEKQKQIINNAINETERLNALCNNILLSSQLESGGYTMTKQEFDFSSMVNSAVNEFRKRYPSRQIGSTTSNDIFYNGEEFLIRLVLNNLLENAIKYTASDVPITIGLRQHEGFIELSVADLGPGIPNKEKEKIFEKFYRLGDEMTRTSKGTGLGLFLSTKIIKDHHGKMFVENNDPSGSIFKIILPK